MWFSYGKLICFSLVLLCTVIHLNFHIKYVLSRGRTLLSRYCSEVLRMDSIVFLFFSAFLG